MLGRGHAPDDFHQLARSQQRTLRTGAVGDFALAGRDPKLSRRLPQTVTASISPALLGGGVSSAADAIDGAASTISTTNRAAADFLIRPTVSSHFRASPQVSWDRARPAPSLDAGDAFRRVLIAANTYS